MATTFHGPWYVVLGSVHFQFRQQRFRISGSDNADGTYPVAFGNSLVLQVFGAKWQIYLEIIPSAIDQGGIGWEATTVRESVKFVLGDGLIVQLDGTFQFEAPDPPTQVITLTCTSMDPEINPIPRANPFSFTLPEGTVPTPEDPCHVPDYPPPPPKYTPGHTSEPKGDY